MRIATHLIKIKGIFDKDIWGHDHEIAETKLRQYVDTKIKDEIENLYHADLELFQIDDNKIEVWVFISAFQYEASKDLIEKWLNEHIKEEGIKVIVFEIDEKSDNNFLVLIP